MRSKQLSVSEVFQILLNSFICFPMDLTVFKMQILRAGVIRNAVAVVRSRDFYENNSGNTDFRSFVSLALHDV